MDHLKMINAEQAKTTHSFGDTFILLLRNLNITNILINITGLYHEYNLESLVRSMHTIWHKYIVK